LKCNHHKEEFPEIVDIHFAKNNYSYLEHVHSIIESSKRINEIDIEMNNLEKDQDDQQTLL